MISKNSRLSCLFFCGIFGLVFSAQLLAEQHDASAEKALREQLTALQSLSATFAQTIRDENNALLQEAKGAMYLQRPNRLYWETSAPYQYKIITDGEVLWRYDADLEQVNRQQFSEQIKDTPAALLVSDLDTLGQRFTISRGDSTSGNRYILVPKQTDGNFRSLTLQFSGERIEQLIMVDSLAQTTDIRFSDVVQNPPIEASRFQFTPPPGIDVIVDEKE